MDRTPSTEEPCNMTTLDPSEADQHRARTQPRWSHLRALGARLSEARSLGVDFHSQLGYLASHYWARFASHVPFRLPELDLPVTVRAHGRELRTHIRSNGSDWGVLRGIFLEREYELVPHPADIKRILDLGANIGFAALYLSVCFPDADVLAIEPMPRNVQACREHFSANAVRGEVIEAACARENGFADLLVTDNASCHSLVSFHDWRTKLHVETFSVPTLMARKGWDAIDLLKVDIEGYEKLLFEGSPAWLDTVRIIIGELHGDYKQPDLQRDLDPYGFEVRTLAVGYETTFVAMRNSGQRTRVRQ
jgi:FkbM family methyltransferase